MYDAENLDTEKVQSYWC